MARINIEDACFLDPRFKKIERAIGIGPATGFAVLAWRLAQQYWCDFDRESGSCKFGGIPVEIWNLSDFPKELIESGLFLERDGEVFARGSEEHFRWLTSKKENGQNGGVKKAVIKNQQLSPSDGLATPKRRSSAGYPPTPTPTPVLALTPALKKEEYSVGEVAVATTPAKVDKPKVDAGKFVAAYIEAFQKKFGKGVRPELSGKVQGQIRTLLKDFGLDKSVQLMQVYLQMDDPWFVKKAYDFSTFVQNLQKVGLSMQTGELSPQKATEWDDFWKEVSVGQVRV